MIILSLFFCARQTEMDISGSYNKIIIVPTFKLREKQKNVNTKATQTDEITKIDPKLVKKCGCYSYILHSKWDGLYKDYNSKPSSSFYPVHSCTIYDGKIQGSLKPCANGFIKL